MLSRCFSPPLFRCLSALLTPMPACPRAAACPLADDAIDATRPRRRLYAALMPHAAGARLACRLRHSSRAAFARCAPLSVIHYYAITFFFAIAAMPS